MNLGTESCRHVQGIPRNQSLFNCSVDPKLSSEQTTVPNKNVANEKDAVLLIKIDQGPVIACTKYSPPISVAATSVTSSDQLGLIIGCVVGVVVILVVVVIIYCIIRKRKNKLKSTDNNQQIYFTQDKNQEEPEYDTIQDGDKGKHESAYQDIEDTFLQNSITNREPNYQNSTTNREPNYHNSTTNREPNYQVIEDDFLNKAKPTSGYSEPWDTCIKLKPILHSGKQPPDPKFKYSMDKPKTGRIQGENASPHYDHVRAETTVDKQTELTPSVTDKTYYDHIKDVDEILDSDPYSDPTYNHLGQNNVAPIGTNHAPHQVIKVDLNSTSKNKDQKDKDDPYNDPTYNHLGQNNVAPIGTNHTPHQVIKVDLNSTSKNKDQIDKDDPYNDPTYNHLGQNNVAPMVTNNAPHQAIKVDLNSTSKNKDPIDKDDPYNDPAYNHLGQNNVVPIGTLNAPQVITVDPNLASMNKDQIDKDDPYNDPTYNQLGQNNVAQIDTNHAPHQVIKADPNSTSKNKDQIDENDPYNDSTYNHLNEDKTISQRNLKLPQEEVTHLSVIGLKSDTDNYNHIDVKNDNSVLDKEPTPTDVTNNHTMSSGGKPMSSDNYNHLDIKGDNHHTTKQVKNPAGKQDNYDHIGIKKDNSVSVKEPRPEGNHTSSSDLSPDHYNHIDIKGDNHHITKQVNNRAGKQDNYDRIGIKKDNSVSDKDSDVTLEDDTYNHITSKPSSSDNYYHIDLKGDNPNTTKEAENPAGSKVDRDNITKPKEQSCSKQGATTNNYDHIEL
ncbi:putative uncharacterized protein DDB_G0282133 [Patella vulgata]|uniref:putative uncharacterized protein DDB_G0282133 n=1 Tax=Patella vulgata TaxID=6465 RepID=UPI0024A93F02|nr:putative uncharacterized protein DDB_G0282133 [Patella vulgata]